MIAYFHGMISTNDKIKLVHTATPSSFEGRTFDESVVFSRLMLVTALIFIFVNFY